MAAPKLIVNGLDLSAYIDVQHEDGLDPTAPSYFQPQYSGTPAFGEGRRFAANSADNREMVFPLLLEGSSRSALHALAAQVNAQLVRNASVEFSSDANDPSSFFTLEGGHLDVKYEYFLTGVALITRSTLYLSVRPYAHTGTARLIASIPQGSSAVVEFPASGILGDAYALANLEVRVGSAVASNGRVAMFGVHPHPSHNPYRPATSGRAQTGATVRGASGAIGSQYTAIPISPTGASGVAYQEYLDPPDAHVGRHRVFGFARSGLSQQIPVYALDRFGAILGATALVTQLDQGKFQVVDLGEIQVPARASGQDSVPTQYVQLIGGGGSGASVVASPGLHLAGLMFLPLDYSAGVMRTEGGAHASVRGDSFARGQIGPYQILDKSPNADRGGVWVRAAPSGVLGMGDAYLGGQHGIFAATTLFESAPGNGATGFYTLGSGVAAADVHAQADVWLAGVTPSVGAASNAHVALYPKMVASGPYTKALLTYGPSPYVAIISGASAGAQNLRASAGMPSLLASGIFLGQKHTLVARVLGGRMDVWLATGALPASPVISASHAELGIAGYPAVDMQQGPGAPSSAVVALSNLLIYAFGASTSDIAAREYFRFESFPEGRVVQGNASVFVADRLANYRGGFPQIPAVGTGAQSFGPARVVAFQAEIDNVVGNDGMDLALYAVERWRFLR